MDQTTELNISPNKRPNGWFRSGSRSFLDRVANWLIFLILILVALLLKDVVFKPVGAPRTALERDIMDYTDALRKNPQNAVAHAGLGVAYMNMARFSPAAREFAEAVRLEPDNAQYHYNLGLAYARLERYDEALKELTAAGKQSPRWEAPFFAAGRVYMDTKKYNKAVLSFEASLRLVPGNADAHYHLGRVYELKGDRNRAAKHYREVLRYVPDYDKAIAAIERLRGK